MVEPSRDTKSDNFIKQLSVLASTPNFSNNFGVKINQVISTVKQISSLLGPKSTFQFEVPSRYLQAFLAKQELRQNPDAANALLEETLNTIQNYMDLLKKMAEEAPEPIIAAPNKSVMEHAKLAPPVQTVQQPKIVYAPVQNMRCTVDIHGIKPISQKAFSCETCNLVGTDMVCEGCALTCHVGHKLIARGVGQGYCDCRFKKAACKLQEACTFKYTAKTPISQQKFICETCKTDASKGQMLCNYCAVTCHKGHKIAYSGFAKRGYCDCNSLYSICHLNIKK